MGLPGPLANDPGTAYGFVPGPGAPGQIQLNLPQVNTTAGGSNTVAFWMNWDGTDNVMPFGFTVYDLWFYNGSFGFNTSVSDLYGISSAGLANGGDVVDVDAQPDHVGLLFTQAAIPPSPRDSAEPRAA